MAGLYPSLVDSVYCLFIIVAGLGHQSFSQLISNTMILHFFFRKGQIKKFFFLFVYMHHFDSLDYTEKVLTFSKFRSLRLHNFPKIACNLNTSCCGRMWAWSHVRSQESFFCSMMVNKCVAAGCSNPSTSEVQ